MDARTWQCPSRDRNEPGVREARATGWVFWLAAALVMVTGIAGLLLVLAPPSYRAEAQVQIGARSFGLIGLRTRIASSEHAAAASASAGSQARLVASRDLARRAIEDLRIDSNPEFDSLAGGSGPASRMLVLLGLKRDPERMTRPERILQAYEDRLSVSAEPSSRLIKIAFQSEDRDFAARAANRIADLFLEMRTQTKDRMLRLPEARIVSRAATPHHPEVPHEAWVAMLGVSATVATAVGTLVVRRRSRPRRPAPSEEPVEQPRSLGETRVLARLGEKARAGQHSTIESARGRVAADRAQEIADVARRILAARNDGVGTSVLMTSCTEAAEAGRFMLTLGRRLGHESRAIVVSFDKLQKLEPMMRGSDSLRAHADAPRLADLFAGQVSFGEVIRRDPASRLHYVAAEADAELDLAGSESALEALAETYDFVLLVAPPLGRDDIATTLAATADLVVLAAPPQQDDIALCKAEADLIDRGAREILILGLPSRLRRSISSTLGRDAA